MNIQNQKKIRRGMHLLIQWCWALIFELHFVSFILMEASSLEGVGRALNKARFDMIFTRHYDPIRAITMQLQNYYMFGYYFLFIKKKKLASKFCIRCISSFKFK